MESLVNWDYSGRWTDTGEGGMFAYMVALGELDDFPTRGQGGCNVDVNITMNRPDVLVSGKNLWKHVKGYPGYSDEEILASIYLGSTNLALSDEVEYFDVTFERLTPKGQQMYKMLESIYGKVDILTFLDT